MGGHMVREAALILLCYIIGSIPFSYIFAYWLKGVDVRQRGSGNVGATNVLRTAGPLVGALALVGDLLKGAAGAWIAVESGNTYLLVLCPLAVVVGHCFSVFLRFRGGKAVASSGGIVLFLFPRVGLILLAIFIVLALGSRYVSLASVMVALVLPFLVWLSGYDAPFILLSAIMAALVIYRHRENLQRLRQGSEPRLGSRA